MTKEEIQIIVSTLITNGFEIDQISSWKYL